MSQPYGPNDHEEQLNGLPGADYVSAIAEIWTRSVAEYAFMYGRTWDQVLSGKFGLADLAKGVTKVWQLQYHAARELIAIPFRQDVAQWRFFHFDKNVPNALVEQVPLTKRQDATADI